MLPLANRPRPQTRTTRCSACAKRTRSTCRKPSQPQGAALGPPERPGLPAPRRRHQPPADRPGPPTSANRPSGLDDTIPLLEKHPVHQAQHRKGTPHHDEEDDHHHDAAPDRLTGNGGDIVLDSCSAAWIGMVQRGDRRAARRQVTGWARARNRAPGDLWRAVTRAAGTTHGEALLSAATHLERGGFDARRAGVWSWCHLGESGKWLTADGRERVAALLRTAAGETTTETYADLAEQRASLRLVGADARDTVALAAAWRVRQVHPYLDNQVVRAAFSIAPVERHGVTSFKPLLPAALPSLPRWLTGRTSKGAFSRQLTAGMVRHRPVLAHLIRTSVLTTGGLLNPEPALAALNGIGGTRADTLYDLQRLIMACHWLAARDQHLTSHRQAAC
ncbi:asparagine synthase-related protein [Streptomyces sp. BE147]|uniref:asparagine synthase-related protein n=1 Tax=Streptomyces sp. BE147 TaxID=3002524 RepID=UPI002E78214F|nr:asparagine synthase-related protein [Streptomyces sp. BE147]MEE1735504.1 asparagine synthase-related protein [Streptomyces sp. BE147]